MVGLARTSNEVASALYYASFPGLDWVLRDLLLVQNVNEQDGIYGNRLQAASAGGHIQISEKLIEMGADVCAEGGSYGNALQAASAEDHIEILELLLRMGADVNARLRSP